MHHALHDVKADAPPRYLGDLLLGRETGKEQEVEQLGLAQPAGHWRGGEPFFHNLGSKPLKVDPPSVVAEHDLEHPRAVAGFQPDRARRVLAHGFALIGSFQPMIERIADQMIERRFETVQNVAIDPGRLTHHLELRLLAKLTSHIADQARKAADAVGQGPHSAGEHLVMQPA